MPEILGNKQILKATIDVPDPKNSEKLRTLYVELRIQSLTFNMKDCFLVECRDITERIKTKEISSEYKLLNFMTTSVSHEMITPLKCMIQIG